MKLSFERLFIGFFLAIIAAVIGLGIVNYNNNKSYYQSSRLVDHTNEVLKLNAKTLSTVQDLTIRSFISTGDSSLLDPYISAGKNYLTVISDLKELTGDNSDQQKRIDSLAIFANARMDLTKTYMALYTAHQITPATLEEYTVKSRLSQAPVRRISADIARAEETLLKLRKEKTEKDKRDFDFSIALVFSVIALLLGACLLAVIYYFNARKRFEIRILRLNTDLQRNISDLHSANKELESFSYSVSHDLRAPLRIIDGFAKIISDEYAPKLDGEGKRFVEAIRSNAQRMGMLIDDLLNFSRIGRQELTVKEINMNTTVQHVIESLALLDSSAAAKIKVEPLQNSRCDEHLIQQVWVNLISNALKYSRNKSNASIVIRSTENPLEYIFSVQDNGVGFDMEFAGKLFSVFQRLHKASEYEGTGVGLALVSRIISKHKGRVWAEAKTNEGATFYFSLPK